MNSAFVFIKPHAVTDATKILVKEGLLAAGLEVLTEGSLSAEEIDSKKLIDQHYYAIASKATILKPHELNVPTDKFEAQFGLTWDAALSAGNVYNAMDACALLGISADEMDAQWGICKKAKKLVKFGGGFYCGLVEIEGKPSLYVFNGFFMSMRSKFTAPGVSIYYYTVQWDSSKLSWADFRGQLLGPTDPADAPAASLRGKIKSQWQALGLAAEPDVGDNGVHASASPFEALAERMNWCGESLESDSFGRALLGANIPARMIKKWTVDPQVSLLGGSMGSLFDALEDMDANPCVDKCKQLAINNAEPLLNSAFVFIKPHAVTDATKILVKEGLLAAGLEVLTQGSLSAEEIDSKKLIDQHYYAIASKATILKPHELNVPTDKFEAQFGLTWDAALAAGNVYNAMDACALLGISADEMDAQWGICKKAKKLVKFGGGFYCGLVEIEGKPSLYVFNGFFMSMRSKFTAPGVSIYYYTVQWDSSKLSWADFRGQLLGPTDPADAPAASLRGKIKSQWQALGLAAEPDVGDNGVHASASPFEALAERMNWCGACLDRDDFGKALLNSGISQKMIKEWTVDPQIVLPNGNKGSMFDSVEDTDAAACVHICEELALKNLEPVKNSAFVFIKPHAVTDATKILVKEGLLAAGLEVLTEGSLSAEEIDSKKLIDQHYYAIASKATILKPHELNVPTDKFEAQFGLTWDAALAAGNVYNAMDACALLGISADEMDAQWGICKKAKKLVKFGGGFYCGLVEIEGKPSLYVFNGFFMSMRSKFTAPGVSIYYYTVQWDSSKLSWADFRGQLLGPTDPADAPAASLRGKIKSQWQALGLAAEPDVGDNGVHASASPFEALAERMNWCGESLESGSFGRALLGANIPARMIKKWTVDPQVIISEGKKGSMFDSVEDTNADDCLLKLRILARLNVNNLYLQDGPEASEIAAVIPYFPFKGIPRFYDIGGFLKNPKVFQQIVDVFVDRYRLLDVDSIGGLDARGFVLGPPIALALGKPFFMLRKPGKMPNCFFSSPYEVEYGKRDGLGIPKDAVSRGDRVLLLDDLVATGGTLSAGIECVEMCGGTVVECGCIVELKFFINQRARFYKSLGIQEVPIWGLISEDVLGNAAPISAEYKDDGEEH